MLIYIKAKAMFNNVGTVDRFIRFLVGGILMYLGLNVYPSSAVGIGLDVAGGILTATGVFSTCLLYGLLGINTRKANQDIQS